MPFKKVPPLYWVWQSMLERCRNKNRKQWKDYGGRGIKVCERWHTFSNFIRDMGPRPTPKHTLERFNNNKDYTPKNCGWATRKDQQRNQTVTIWVSIDGKKHRAVDLADIAQVKTDTILARVAAGLPYESVVTTGRLNWKNGRYKDCCINNHPYTTENTRILPNGRRVCRTCGRLNAQKTYWIKKEST